ncbi:MAG: pantetheine-phosphate adenylyltransferase [Ignavibacteriae bacterium]|nr:pantetheine-phosphate adenylyltransferase [Ignavibacteriota bacterium]MCB9216669.1 pantetheine-phosphate adenylyltransferase [Ignavibacteria bacterium]
MKRALYPGTFDPITNGHLDIIDRSARIFDEVIVTVAVNSSKQTLFTDEERVDLIEQSIREVLPDSSNIRVEKVEGLLVDFARKVGAVTVLRGLRTLGDFEYEMQMALMNRRLYGELSTFFVAADERYIHLNSSIVRELARYGATLPDLVPDCVARALREKMGRD